MKSLVYSTVNAFKAEAKPRKLVSHIISNFGKVKSYLIFKYEAPTLKADVNEVIEYFRNNLDQGDEVWERSEALLKAILNNPMQRYFNSDTGYVIVSLYMLNDKLSSIDTIGYVGTKAISNEEVNIEPVNRKSPGIWINMVKEYDNEYNEIESWSLKVKLSPDFKAIDTETGKIIAKTSVFSNIKKLCSTPQQRKSFNALIKSFGLDTVEG